MPAAPVIVRPAWRCAAPGVPKSPFLLLEEAAVIQRADDLLMKGD
jgi:hypothetical protein